MFVDTEAARSVWLTEYNRIIEVPSRGELKPCHAYVSQVAYAKGYKKGAAAWFIEEALQRAWVKSWFHFSRFDPFKAQFSTWVIAIFENELASLYHERSGQFRILTEADFPERDIVDLSNEHVAHYDVKQRQPDDTTALDKLDDDVRVAALKVLRETGDLARGWQARVAELLGLSRTRITQLLQEFRKAVVWESGRESGGS